MRHTIGFYTFYQIFNQYSDSEQQTTVRKLTKLIENLEAECNKKIANQNYKIKIHLDLITPAKANYLHYKNYLKSNPDISVICQAPNYFKNENLNILHENKICFDSFRVISEKSSNVYRTPLSSGSDIELKMAKKVFEDNNLIHIVCLTAKKINKNLTKELNSLKARAVENNTTVKIILGWRDNDHRNLIDYLGTLNNKDYIFLDKFSFVDEQGPVQTKINNRSDFLNIFSKTKSESSLCVFRLPISQIKIILSNKDHLLNNKIYNFVGEDYFEKLDLQERILSLNNNPLEESIEQYLSWYFQIILDKIQLIVYLLSKDNFKIENNYSFANEIKLRLNNLNGKDDIFVGSGELISFQNNEKESPKNFVVTYDYNLDNSINTNLHKKQVFVSEKKIKTIPVNYPGFDFIRLNNIAIESSTFESTFYFELTTIFEKGIEIIKFNNAVDQKISWKLVKSQKISNEHWYFRYFVSGSFSFFPASENYPFDKQLPFISYSLLDQKYGILQPIKSTQIDKEFNSDGWAKLGYRAGVIRKKEKFSPIIEKSYVLVNEDYRIGIVLSRPSSFAIIKILVPLMFLVVLTLYSLYLPLDKLETTIALISTSFLSAIALYFSTDRPKPLVITTIDLIFMFFYFFVGLASIAIFCLSLIPDYYDKGIFTYRIISYLILTGGVLFTLNRINSKRYYPKMLFNDKT